MTFVIATHNAHKLAELQRILRPLGIDAVTADLTEAEETGTTFAENAFLKAQSACRETGMPAVADDSGLIVDALKVRRAYILHATPEKTRRMPIGFKNCFLRCRMSRNTQEGQNLSVRFAVCFRMAQPLQRKANAREKLHLHRQGTADLDMIRCSFAEKKRMRK